MAPLPAAPRRVATEPRSTSVGLNTEAIDKAGLAPIRPLLAEIGHLPSLGLNRTRS